MARKWCNSRKSHEKHMLEAPKSRITRETKCDSYTLHPYYIYPYYPQNCKEAIQKKTIKMFCGGTNLSTALLSIASLQFWE